MTETSQEQTILEVKLGYRIKTKQERTGGPEDKILVPLDPKTQAEFEQVILALVYGEDKRRD